MNQTDITRDPRFAEGVRLFNAGEYLEASDCFEELFFEAIRDEPDFVRIFLQFAVGMHHVEMKQRRPAVERIEEGLLLITRVHNQRGVDLAGLASEMKRNLANSAAAPPQIRIGPPPGRGAEDQ